MAKHNVIELTISEADPCQGPVAEQNRLEMLDNPIWNALRTEHASIALGAERARRYPPFIGPLSGISGQSPESYAALRELAAPAEALALFSVDEPRIGTGWTLLRGGRLHQMVHTRAEMRPPATPSGNADLRKLTAADAPAMVDLAELTEPGPFRLRTPELGTFFGVFHGDRLMAMAGKRMHLPGFVEVSGVCTHPDARGRGYAAICMARVIDEITRDGKVAFLHVLVDNGAAIHVYEKLGFEVRQTFHLAVLKNEA